MAEAEGEGTEGKALVMKVVLNRVESREFPNSIEDVVFQPGQFEPVKWKAKLDSYNPGKAITDLKVVARMDKLPMWRYDLQGAIYQKGVEIVTGEKLPFYLAVVTKERVMDRDIWQIPQSTLDIALRQVEENIGRYADIKAGLLEPVHCGRCDYCKSIKQAAVRNYNELLEA